MLGILFDIFLFKIARMAAPSDQKSTRNDVFIPFDDRCSTRTQNTPIDEGRSDYYPHDFDDFNEY